MEQNLKSYIYGLSDLFKSAAVLAKEELVQSWSKFYRESLIRDMTPEEIQIEEGLELYEQRRRSLE